jgi:thermitase
MKTHFRKMLLLVALFLLAASLFPPAMPGQAASAAEPPTPAGDFKAGELLVKFETGMTLNATENLLSRYQATQIRALYRSDVQLWSVPAGQELEIVASLNANPAVVYAEPNYLYHAFDTTPNDPHFISGKQWAHTKIQSPAAWDITTGSDAITIAIIDTGIDEGHPDLASKIVAGYDYVGGDSNPHDRNGHGTHCAGIAAAITDNSAGVAGVSWGAKIMPLRVLDEEGSGWSSDITSAITWAYTNGADTPTAVWSSQRWVTTAPMAIPPRTPPPTTTSWPWPPPARRIPTPPTPNTAATVTSPRRAARWVYTTTRMVSTAPCPPTTCI